MALKKSMLVFWVVTPYFGKTLVIYLQVHKACNPEKQHRISKWYLPMSLKNNILGSFIHFPVPYFIDVSGKCCIIFKVKSRIFYPCKYGTDLAESLSFRDEFEFVITF